MTTDKRGTCTLCGRDDLSLHGGKCSSCRIASYEDSESPSVLPGRWVPNGRGTLDYVEHVA